MLSRVLITFDTCPGAQNAHGVYVAVGWEFRRLCSHTHNTYSNIHQLTHAQLNAVRVRVCVRHAPAANVLYYYYVYLSINTPADNTCPIQFARNVSTPVRCCQFDPVRCVSLTLRDKNICQKIPRVNGERAVARIVSIFTRTSCLCRNADVVRTDFTVSECIHSSICRGEMHKLPAPVGGCIAERKSTLP